VPKGCGGTQPVGPDPDPRPECNPPAIAFAASRDCAEAGLYVVDATVGDDDGGSTSVTELVAV